MVDFLPLPRCLSLVYRVASLNAKVERTIVWVRFPGLNIVYYDESFLMIMTSAIGRPIKVDINTLNVKRGRFARVCVEVDLTVPVVGKIWVNGHSYKVQYEGLHIIYILIMVVMVIQKEIAILPPICLRRQCTRINITFLHHPDTTHEANKKNKPQLALMQIPRKQIKRAILLLCPIWHTNQITAPPLKSCHQTISYQHSVPQ
jgi:hypothetical protein